jgi:hypothetical protein
VDQLYQGAGWVKEGGGNYEVERKGDWTWQNGNGPGMMGE